MPLFGWRLTTYISLMAAMEKLNLSISGMHCANCATTIERELRGMSGISECRVNLATRSGLVVFDRDILDAAAIIERIKTLGYQALPGTPDVLSGNIEEESSARRRLLLVVVFAAPLMLLAMGGMLLGRPWFSVGTDAIAQAVLTALILGMARLADS